MEFWDDEDRLIAAQIVAPIHSIHWTYHYLGSTMIVATRSDVNAGTIKRFWAITDERGLVYRMLDEQGATFWQARWDATGWRQLVGTPQPNMRVPFALPGQVVLDETRAFSSSAAVRPEIALNQWRSYDPNGGSFMQRDPMDEDLSRYNPEGYVYGRNSPLSIYDRGGLFSDTDREPLRLFLRTSLTNIEGHCSANDFDEIVEATVDALMQIDGCTKGLVQRPPPQMTNRW